MGKSFIWDGEKAVEQEEPTLVWDGKKAVPVKKKDGGTQSAFSGALETGGEDIEVPIKKDNITGLLGRVSQRRQTEEDVQLRNRWEQVMKPELKISQQDFDTDPVNAATRVILSKSPEVKRMDEANRKSLELVQKPVEKQIADKQITLEKKPEFTTKDAIIAIQGVQNYYAENTNKSLAHLSNVSGIKSADNLYSDVFDEQIRNSLRPGNQTDQIAYKRLQEAKIAKKVISESIEQGKGLDEMAVDYISATNPEMRDLITQLKNVPTLGEAMSGKMSVDRKPSDAFYQATTGMFLYEFLNSSAINQEAEKIPGMKTALMKEANHLIQKYPEFGRMYMGSLISQEMEDLGINNAILNVATRQERDKAVKSLVEKGIIGDREVAFYEKEIRPLTGLGLLRRKVMGNAVINTPGALENATEGAYTGFKNIAKGIYDLTGLREAVLGQQGATRQDLETAMSQVGLKPKGIINEIAMTGGNVLGQSLSIGAGGRFLNNIKAANNINNAMGMVGGLQAYANYMPQARLKFPGDEMKQRAYATILSGIEWKTENIFNDQKVIDGILGKVKPGIAETIQDFTSKKITASAARAEVKSLIEKAMLDLPNAAKYFARGIARNDIEELSAELGDQVTTGVFEGKPFDEWINGERLVETARVATLGGGFIGALSANADLKKNRGLTAKNIYDMTDNADYWKGKISEMAMMDEQFASEAQDKIENLEYAQRVKADLDNTGMTERQKQKSLIIQLERYVKQKDQVSNTIQGLHSSAIEKLDAEQRDILDGKDDGTIEGDVSDELTPNETKAVKLAAKQGLPGIYGEIDPLDAIKEISYQAQGLTEDVDGNIIPVEGGGRQQDILDMGVSQEMIDAAIKAFPAPKVQETKLPDQSREIDMGVEETPVKESGGEIEGKSPTMQLYHGGIEGIVDFKDKGTGVYLTPNKEIAEEYASIIQKQSEKENSKQIPLPELPVEVIEGKRDLMEFLREQGYISKVKSEADKEKIKYSKVYELLATPKKVFVQDINGFEKLKSFAKKEVESSFPNIEKYKKLYKDYLKTEDGGSTDINFFIKANKLEDIIKAHIESLAETKFEHFGYKESNEVFPIVKEFLNENNYDAIERVYDIRNEEPDKVYNYTLGNRKWEDLKKEVIIFDPKSISHAKEKTAPNEPIQETPEAAKPISTEEGIGVKETVNQEGGGAIPPEPPKETIKAASDRPEGDPFKEDKLDRLANNVEDTGKVAKYLSGETIEKYTGEEPQNDQTRGVQELEIALNHGEKIIEEAKNVFGDDYVEKTLDYIERSKAGVSSKALMYVSLENALGKEKLANPENAAEIAKLQKLVYEKSQAFARESSLALNYQKLRRIANVGYDISKVTDAFFSKEELVAKGALEKAVEANPDIINEQYAAQETGAMTPEVERMIKEGIEKEVAKIYEALPKEKKSLADRAIAALEKAQAKLRSNTYDAGLGIPVAIIDAGISTIKLAIKAGVEISKAIELGISKIKEKYGKELEKEREDNLRKDFKDVFKPVEEEVRKAKPVKDIVKEALIEKGFGREIEINGEKKKILDWKKLAGAAGSISNIRKNVNEVLQQKGWAGLSDAEKGVIKEEFIKEYVELRESVIQKAQNELAKRNKETVTPTQKSAAKKLAELYTYGLFDAKYDEYENTLNKALGAKVSEEGFRDAKKIAYALENIYSSSFKGIKLNDVSAKAAIEKLEDQLRILLYREARAQGNTNLKIANIVRSFMDVSQTMLLNNLKQAVENPLSGKQQDLIDAFDLVVDKSSSKELRDRVKKARRNLYKNIVLNGGVPYGKVESQFVNRQHLDDFVNRLSDSKLYHGIASVLTGKATLNAIDAKYKLSITEKKFTKNLITLLTDKSNPNRMSKEDAVKFVTEKLTGQTYEDAKDAAKKVIEKINKDAGVELIKVEETQINRLANDIVKASLEMGNKLSPELITAAYNAAYKSAGLGLGHEANNFLSQMLKGVSAKMEGDINRAIKEKKWNKAALLTYSSVLFRNILNPFVGGGTNWIVLKMQKTGLGLFTGVFYHAGAEKLDISTPLGVQRAERAMYEQARFKDQYMRGLIGGIVSLSGYALYKGLADDDEYRKWRKENPWAARYLDVATPEILMAEMGIKDKNFKGYIEKSFNRGDAFDPINKGIKAMEYYSKGEKGKMWGALGEMVGMKLNVPLPWRLAKDVQVLYQGVSGQDPYHGNYKPSNGFLSGVMQGGALEYFGVPRSVDDGSEKKPKRKSRRERIKERRERRNNNN